MLREASFALPVARLAKVSHSGICDGSCRNPRDTGTDAPLLCHRQCPRTVSPDLSVHQHLWIFESFWSEPQTNSNHPNSH